MKFVKGVTCGFSNRSESGEKAERSQRSRAKNARATPGLNSFEGQQPTDPRLNVKKDLKDFACVKDCGACGAVGRADGRIFFALLRLL